MSMTYERAGYHLRAIRRAQELLRKRWPLDISPYYNSKPGRGGRKKRARRNRRAHAAWMSWI